MDSIIYWARWFVAIPMGLVFILCVIGNWGVIFGGLYETWIKGNEFSSSFIFPFFGPIVGIVFLLVVPIEGPGSLFWLAAIIEPTWILGVVSLLAALFSKDAETDKSAVDETGEQKS